MTSFKKQVSDCSSPPLREAVGRNHWGHGPDQLHQSFKFLEPYLHASSMLSRQGVTQNNTYLSAFFLFVTMLLVKVNGAGVKKYGLYVPVTIYLATTCQL